MSNSTIELLLRNNSQELLDQVFEDYGIPEDDIKHIISQRHQIERYLRSGVTDAIYIAEQIGANRAYVYSIKRRYEHDNNNL